MFKSALQTRVTVRLAIMLAVIVPLIECEWRVASSLHLHIFVIVLFVTVIIVDLFVEYIHSFVSMI